MGEVSVSGITEAENVCHKIMMEVMKAATSGRIMRRRTMERNRAVIRREDRKL